MQAKVGSEITVVNSLLTAIGSVNPPSEREITKAMATIASHEFLPVLLEQIKSNRSLFDALCRRSYSHPLAFSKLVLLKDEVSGSQIRLHVWSNELSETVMEPHTHTRDFWSMVLIGGLNVVDYVEVRPGKSYYKYETTARQGAAGYSYSRQDLLHLKKIKSVALNAGGLNTHHLKYDKIHTTVPFEQVDTVTLFLQGPVRSKHSIVYSPNSSKEGQVYSRSLSRDEMSLVLMDAMEMTFNHDSIK